MIIAETKNSNYFGDYKIVHSLNYLTSLGVNREPRTAIFIEFKY